MCTQHDFHSLRHPGDELHIVSPVYTHFVTWVITHFVTPQKVTSSSSPYALRHLLLLVRVDSSLNVHL